MSLFCGLIALRINALANKKLVIEDVKSKICVE